MRALLIRSLAIKMFVIWIETVLFLLMWSEKRQNDTGKAAMNKFQRWLCKLTLNSDDREAIYDNFRHYLLDGQSLEKTFDKMIVNYTRRGKKPNNEIAQILTDCAAHLKEGHSLGEALKSWFPEQELSV
ncbi:PilR type IV pilus biosynthesis protein, partial [Candidatus Regiella insecticola 5.15]